MMCLTAGQTSEHIGARRLYPTLLQGTRTLIGDKGYDSDAYRKALSAKGITVISREEVWSFFEHRWLEFVPFLHRLQGRLAAQG